MYLYVCSETLEVCETKYLNASHWLISSVNSFYIGVGFNPFTVVTVSTVAVTLCNIQGGSNMTGTDLCVNKPRCAAAVRP